MAGSRYQNSYNRRLAAGVDRSLSAWAEFMSGFTAEWTMPLARYALLTSAA